MKPLAWIPEVYPKSGGLASAGFYKLLGRPRLDPLTVLVRETAQNSWDARLRDQAVRFEIEGWTPMWEEELDVIRRIVFPESGRPEMTLEAILARETVDGIFISDRGTRGLGGPIAADEVAEDDVYDWVDFVLNVGKPNLQGQTGGTYGFGKTIAYIVSAANAVVVHTRTMHGGDPQTRLIACAISDEFKNHGRLHTGRHWWGEDAGGAPAPVTGGRADEIADAIGMPIFESEDLGTNILVVAPEFGGRTPKQAMRFLAESVTWHLWPKLMPHPPYSVPPMEISISWNGEPVAVPSPEDRPPLHGFAQAFRALLDGVDEGKRADGLEHVAIRSFRPKAEIGDVVTVPLVARTRADVDDGHNTDDDDSPAAAASIPDVCHHVALLRTPELVVDYLPGPPPSDGGTEWAAVFRCRPGVDAHFAASEPPVHDSWQPALLQKSAGKTIVKVGLQRVREFLADRWGPPPSVEPRRPDAASTAIVADELARIVAAIPGLGQGGEKTGSTGGGGGRGNARAEILSSGVAIVDGEPVTKVRIRVTPAIGTAQTLVTIAAGVALDNSGSDPDLDPKLALVTAELDGRSIPLRGTTAEIDLPGTETVEFTLTVRRSADTAVNLNVHTQAVRS
jgi:hypothetical protein